MSHQDQGCHSANELNHQVLKGVIAWLLAGIDLTTIRFRALCRWTPCLLITTAILWVWSDERTLKGRFATGRKIVQRGKREKLPGTYQAFTKMLRKWTPALRLEVMLALQMRMEQDLADRFTLFGFVVFGVDGSRLELPRTESNEARFSPCPKQRQRKSRRGKRGRRQRRSRKQSAAARAKKADSPQMWLTTMWHTGTGLPWDWRSGPSDSSERAHMLQMIDNLPPQALVTADAGFVGYDYWETLLASGRQFLIRVGANVRLLRKLGYAKESGNCVYLWPERTGRQGRPPLVLRLVVANTGRHPMYLVTSVLDRHRLSDAQVVELYRRRWGIELYYRHFKQTFDRRKLRSKSADNAQVELEWSMLGLWALCLHAQHQLAHAGVPPERVSVATALDAYRAAMREYKSRSDRGEDLYTRLRGAVIDEYQRTSKASRNYPLQKQREEIGAPKISNATPAQTQKAREIKRNVSQRLTA